MSKVYMTCSDRTVTLHNYFCGKNIVYGPGNGKCSPLFRTLLRKSQGVETHSFTCQFDWCALVI